jgi:hypothetical protein
MIEIKHAHYVGISKDVYKTMICRCFNKKNEIKLGINGLLLPNYKKLVKVQKIGKK